MKKIIFDLDGTLINSAPGILLSLRPAFSRCGLSPIKKLEPGLIGPPLNDILQSLLHPSDDEALDCLIQAFTEHYDRDGYRSSEPFSDVGEMLVALHQSEQRVLYVATNKRYVPTQRILAFLGWESFFHGVYSIDSFQSKTSTKAELLRRLLIHGNLNCHDCIYVGDRLEDADAALKNNIEFLGITFGLPVGAATVFTGDHRKASSVKSLSEQLCGIKL